MKGTAAGVGILAAPAIISRKALASSGEVNFMGWAGYPDLAEKVFPAFEKATGIKVIFNEQPDQDAMFAQAKLSLQTGAHRRRRADRRPHRRLGVQRPVQGWTRASCPLDNYLPGLADGADGRDGDCRRQAHDRAQRLGHRGDRLFQDRAPTEYGTASLGDLFDPKYEGKVCLRPHSTLAAMGR